MGWFIFVIVLIVMFAALGRLVFLLRKSWLKKSAQQEQEYKEQRNPEDILTEMASWLGKNPRDQRETTKPSHTTRAKHPSLTRVWIVSHLLFLSIVYVLFLLCFLFLGWGAFFAVSAVVLLVLMNGLRRAPSSPTMVARKFLGNFVTRTNAYGESHRVVLEEGGQKFFLLCPFVFDGVLVDTSDRNYTDEVEGLRTFQEVALGGVDESRVGTGFKVPFEITWYVDPERADKFFQSCQIGDAPEVTEAHFKRVEQILHGRMTEQLIRVASTLKERPESDHKGRITWEDFFEDNERISSEVIKGVISTERGDGSQSVSDEDAQKVRNGNGKLSVLGLGICLKRLNLQEPVLPPEIEAAVTDQEKERRQTLSESIQNNAVLGMAGRAVEASGGGISWQSAIDLVQTERGKVTRVVHDIRGGGVTGAVPLINIPADERKP